MTACQTCKHCVLHPGADDTGICRRYPPQVTGQGGSSFPVVRIAEWICGEFARKSPAKTKKSA